MLLKIWYNPLFRTCLGLYTLGMGWGVILIVYSPPYFETHPLSTAIAGASSLFLVSWLITQFAIDGANQSVRDKSIPEA